MSNLSDIGFPVENEQDVNKVIMDILPHLDAVPCPPHGFYYKFEDDSGALIYLQTNAAQEIIGFNPAFVAESRRLVEIEAAVTRDTSDLDGAFRCTNKHDEAGVSEYPFVFDAPDFRVHDSTGLPATKTIGLTAFGSSDLEIYGSPEEYRSAAGDDLDLANKSFIPSGLYSFSKDGEPIERDPPQAHAIIAGRITQWQKRRNGFTDEEFYCFVVESFGGFVDVVADPRLVKSEPNVGGIVKGSFWLSGKIV
ncbi:MAG: hypothetical protein OEM82_04025 [Acidobacteriota bacterium]|nr:hypothetical protein [Acidobacteriota bacterium]MDH3530387.1 hypothetical protein [Acidobacteriota bacterium]